MKILDIEADDDDFIYFVLTYFLLEHPTVKSTSTLYNQEEVYKETRFVVVVQCTGDYDCTSFIQTQPSTLVFYTFVFGNKDVVT